MEGEVAARPRIAVFTLGYLPSFVGGAEVAVREIAERLGSEFDFDIYCARFDSDEPALDRLAGARVFRVGRGWRGARPGQASGLRGFLVKASYPFLAAAAAARRHRVEPYAVVWAIMAAFGGTAARIFLALRSRRIPRPRFLLTLQEGTPPEEIRREALLIWPLFRSVFRRADRVQAISRYLAEWAASWGVVAPIDIVPNGVDVAAFAADRADPELRDRLSLPASAFLVATVSRLVRKNGVDTLIEAIAKTEGVALAIFGDGPDRFALEALARKLGVSARVRFAGEVRSEDLPAYLKSCQAFARLSRTEGFGNVFIEGMAAGLPVIATAVGGIVDFARDGGNCLLVDPERPDLAAAAIERIRGDAALRETLVAGGAETATGHDWNLVAGQMGDIFRLLV
jgi:glycosyltransferase involved in cell wall biosynthesis